MIGWFKKKKKEAPQAPIRVSIGEAESLESIESIKKDMYKIESGIRKIDLQIARYTVIMERENGLNPILQKRVKEGIQLLEHNKEKEQQT
jgi:hypothetical protein